MNELAKLFQNKGIRRLVIFLLIALVLFSMRSMINFILLTFIFTFLMDRLTSFVIKRVPINRKVTVLLLYTIIVGILILGIVKYLPIIISEITQLIKQVTTFYQQPQDSVVINYLVSLIDANQISQYIEQGITFLMKYFSDFSTFALQFFLYRSYTIINSLEKESGYVKSGL